MAFFIDRSRFSFEKISLHELLDYSKLLSIDSLLISNSSNHNSVCRSHRSGKIYALYEKANYKNALIASILFLFFTSHALSNPTLSMIMGFF